jgi:hypothetical protein
VEDKDLNLGRIVSRSLTEKVSDARAGFGRFKDAVGIPSRRSHPQSHSHHRHRQRDSVNLDAVDTAVGDGEVDHNGAVVDEKDFGHIPEESIDTPPTESLKQMPRESNVSITSRKLSDARAVPPEIHIVPETPPVTETDEQDLSPIPAQAEEITTQESEGQDEEIKDLELTKTRSTEVPTEQDTSEGTVFRCLRRSQSFPDERASMSTFARKGRWPRHLSFSTVEEVVLVWEGFKTVTTAETDKEPAKSLEDEILQECVFLSDAQAFSSGVLDLSQQTVPWVEEQVTSVEFLHRKANALSEELGYLYPERLEDIQELRERINQLFGDEGSRLTEEMKKIELLGAKLDYELNVLESKIEDVEEGLQDFQ